MKHVLPLFPLDAVLLPETHLPFHVFEPRYRTMLADALAGERLIGLHTLDPAAAGPGRRPPRPPPFGCAGEVVEHEPLPDGRSNIVLRGAFRYRLGRGEEPGGSYRFAEVEEAPVLPLPQGREGGPRTARPADGSSPARSSASPSRSAGRRHATFRGPSPTRGS